MAPDAQVAGGAGLGLNGKIDNNFLGRLRVGALYAYEPYWVDAGFIVEVGALSGFAIGGQVEWNEFHGLFANAGLTYSRNQELTAHLGAGYMIFALEYQHGFGERDPSDALLFNVRFPLGFWWFTSGREHRPFTPPPSTPPSKRPEGDEPPKVKPLGPTQPSTARAAAPEAAQAPLVDPQTRERIERSQHALEEATVAGLRADYAAQSDALRRAYAAQPDALLFVRIADAELALGRRARAMEALTQFLASSATSDAASVSVARVQAEARIKELAPQLARLRLTLTAARGDERVEIDVLAQPAVLLGYDVWLDPGSHQLRVLRGEAVLHEGQIDAQPGQVVRVDLALQP